MKLKDFELKDDPRYYSCKTKDYELCLEPCLNGYDVAIYDKDQSLLEEKVCTDIKNYSPWSRNSSIAANSKALKIAEKLKTKYLQNT